MQTVPSSKEAQTINTIPDKDYLISAIKHNLPSFLLEQPIWLAYYYKRNPDGTYSKPPCKGYTVKDDEPGVSFGIAIKDGYPGIKINKHNNLIAFDVDDHEAKKGNREFSTKVLPDDFKAFLNKHRSYTEISPSKCGLRTLFLCNDKSSLPGRVNLNSELCVGGELFANSGYVTVTGNALRKWDIKEISASEIVPWFKKNGDQLEPEPEPDPSLELFKQASSLPDLDVMLEALRLCRLDQSAAVRRAYEVIMNQSYNHYDYWFKVMSAVHNYMSILGTNSAKIFANILEWSQSDTEAYVDDDDVMAHWSSLSDQENKISYNTLFKFARLIKFDWPVEKVDRKGIGTGKPLINEYKNFKYLMEYFDISFYHEPYTNGLYVETDIKTIENYFIDETTAYFFGKVGPFSQEDLVATLWTLAQDNHYDNIPLGTIAPIAKTYISKTTKKFNLMDQWLNTEYKDLPPELLEPGTDSSCSNIDYIIDCLKLHPLQNKDLAKKYLEAFFFGIVMPIYNPNRIWPEHNFMLILTGPENCRKSSFFSSLMPPQFKNYLITHSTETLSSAKSLRDFMIQMTSSALLVIDEFEIFYNRKNDSLFKSLVTCDSVDYIPIYSKMMTKTIRTAALAGTTNQQKLPLEQDSSRRVALVEVSFIDTDSLMKVNWHHFYRSYVERGKELLKAKKYPWKLSQANINMQYQENERFRAPTELEYVLKELYDFDYEFPGLEVIKSVQSDNTWLSSRNDVIGTIKQKYPSMPVKIPALVNVLEQLCGKFTSTSRTSRDLPNCKGTISKGIVKQAKYTKYVMPPKLTDFNSE